MRVARAAALVFALSIAPHQARAAVGEENITLGLILAEIVAQTKNIGETAYYVKEGFGVAADSMKLLKDATTAVKNVALIIKDPAGFAQWAYRSWVAAYPPLREIRGHIDSIKKSARELHEIDMDNWEPGAFMGVVNGLYRLEGRSYRVALHSEDLFGAAESKKEMFKAIEDDHRRAVETLDELAGWISGKSLSQKEAAVTSAKSDSITAVNAARSATALQQMATHQEVSFLNRYYRHLKAKDAFSEALSLPDTLPRVRQRRGVFHGEVWAP